MRHRYSRREFLGLSAGASLGWLGMTAGSCSRGRAPARDHGQRRNVLFMVLDDLNSWLGCLGGHPSAQTPHMDALARDAVLFTRAYCPSPLCHPSRVSVLTGVMPATSGVYRNDQTSWSASLVPLFSHFASEGYRLVGGGKIFDVPTGHPLLARIPWSAARFAFHGRLGEWDDFLLQGASPMPARRPLSDAPGPPERGFFDWGPLDVEPERMPDWQLADWAIGQLSAPRDQPLFLACGFHKPHLPWYVPRAYFEAFEGRPVPLPPTLAGDLDDVPAIPRGWALEVELLPDQEAGVRPAEFLHEEKHWRAAVVGYLASLRFVDDCVGRLVAALDASPYADDTIVVLWSDHGFHLGEKDHWRKGTLWEEATRVPLIIRAPGLAGMRSRCDRTVGLLDLYPTLVELCGLPRPSHLEGTSLVPLLEDPARPWERAALTTYLPNNHSIRTERWRYTRYEDGGEELYDHEADPFEWHNLAKDPGAAQVRSELRRGLEARIAA